MNRKTMFTILNKIFTLSIIFFSCVCLAGGEKVPLAWNLRTTDHHFVGRESYLKDLNTRLLYNSNNLSIVTLAGINGVGKTYLAIEYAIRNTKNYDIVWFINANGNIERQMIELLDEWKSKDSQLTLPLKTQTNIETLKDLLRTTQLNWLLIFDDVSTKDLIEPYIPEHHGPSHGHVIVTTHNYSAWGNVIKLEPFSRDESICLITKITQEQDLENAAHLASLLFDYPLSINLAANSIRSSITMNIKDYLNTLKTKPSDYEPINGAKLVLEKHFNELKLQNKTAYELLAFLSLCESQNIPEALVKNWFHHHFKKSDNNAYNKAMSTLADYSYIDLANINLSRDTSIKLYKVHSIVQKIIMDLLEPDQIEIFIKSGAKIFTETFSSKGKDILLPEFENNIHHAKSFLKFAKQLDIYNEELARIFVEVLEFYLVKIRDYQKAYQFSKEYAFIKIEKTSDPLLARYHNNISNLSWAIGEHQKGIEHCKAAIKLIKLSKDSFPELLRAYSYLTDHQLFINDLTNAEKTFDLLNKLIEKYGFPSDKSSPNYYYTPALFKQVEANVAYAKNDINQANKSITECENLMLTFMKEFDLPNSPFLTMLTIYLSKYMIWRQTPTAERYHEHIENVLKETLPLLPEGAHKIVGVLKIHLAHALIDNDLATAESYALEAINILNKWYQIENKHKDQAFAHMVLGDILIKADKIEEGKAEYLIAEKIYQSVFNEMNCMPLAILHN